MRHSTRLIEKEIIKQSNMIIDQEIKELRQLKIPFKSIKKNTNKESDFDYDSDGDVIMRCGNCNGNHYKRCKCPKDKK